MLVVLILLLSLPLAAQNCAQAADDADKQVAAGKYAQAKEIGAKAVELCRAAEDKKNEATAWNAIGLAHLYSSEYDLSVANFERALALDKITGQKVYQVRRLNNIATARYYEGRYQDSFAAYQAADQVEKQPLTSANLAVLYQRLGRFEAALNLYRERRLQHGYLQVSEEARILVNEGTLYRRLGDPYKALATYAKARELYRQQAHKDGQMVVEKNSAIAQALDLKNYPAALKGFDELVALASSTHSKRELMQAYLYRAEVKFRMKDEGGASADWEQARALAAEIHAPDDEWKALHGLARAAKPEAAIEYETRALAIIEGMRSGLESRVLRPEFLADKRDVYDGLIARLIVLPQPPLERILELMERARARMFQDQLRRAVSIPSVKIAEIQKSLDEKTALWAYWWRDPEPVVIWITRTQAGLSHGLVTPFPDQGIEKLWVLNDGPMASKSMDTLPWKPGQLLIERFEISHAPSISLLTEAHAPAKWLWPWKPQALAFSNPAAGGAGLLPGDEGWLQPDSTLNYASKETNDLRSLLKGTVEVHTGAEADKAYLTQAGKARILHIATHGAANEEEPDRSRLLFARGQYLFLNEIYALKLDGVELATLSACETERGRFVKGEGVQSLGRAFLTAGARTTLTTLWRVDDAATAQFMSYFYYFLSKGETKAHALREAKLRFLRSGSEWAKPQYWAGFVLTGEGFSPMGRVVTLPQILAASSGFVILPGLLLTVLRRRKRQ